MLKDSIFKTLKKHFLLCVFLVFVIVGIMLLSLAPAYILQGFIDNVLGKNKESALLFYSLAYLCALLFVGIFELLKQVALVIIGENITRDIRLTLSKKLDTISPLYFSQTDAGQLTSIFINDVDTINTIFSSGLIGMIIDLLKVLGIAVSMFFFSPRLGILTAILIPIIYLISRLFKKKMFSAQLKNRTIIGKANNHIAQSVKARPMIKMYSIENYMSKKYYNLLCENYKAVEKVNFYDSIYSPIIKTIMAVIIAFILVACGVNLSFLGLSVGALAASVTLIESLFSPIENVGMELQNLQGAMSGIRRVNEFLNVADEPEKADYTLEQIIPSSAVELTFSDVNFSYQKDVPIIKNLNLTVFNGQKITFVGRTGVGKSTLFKLVTGLLKGDGKIAVNGVDVYSIKSELKPYIFGYVEQSFSYISGSVKDNITLGNNLTDLQVQTALNSALLGDVIKSLPQGIDTPFDCALFSKGQLQLLGIARALVYDPPILLLDEVTANIDAITEKQILDILQKVASTRVILSISHKSSSIINSDKIISLT